MSKGITFGSDPELFLVEPGTRQLVPPEFLMEFSGLKPLEIQTNEIGVRHPIFVKNKEFSIIGDGALFEFTLKPAKKMSQLYTTFKKAKETLGELASKYKLEILHSPIADFNIKKYLEDMDSEIVKGSVIAGCDPDQDAIDSEYESKVRNITFWPKRGAGGHLHLGVSDVPELHDWIIPAVQLLAITVGNAYISKVKDIASEKQRQEVFGKPGRFRPQKYGKVLGVEYRTPSNSWLLSEDSVNLIELSAIKAIEFLKKPKEGKKIIEAYLADTIGSIINVDTKTSKTILADIL